MAIWVSREIQLGSWNIQKCKHKNMCQKCIKKLLVDDKNQHFLKNPRACAF